jgi:hypothetical protein
MITAEKTYSSVISAKSRKIPASGYSKEARESGKVAEEAGARIVSDGLVSMTAAEFVAVFMEKWDDENNSPEKEPPLIRKLSGVISEADLKRISREDERVRHILRDDG